VDFDTKVFDISSNGFEFIFVSDAENNEMGVFSVWKKGSRHFDGAVRGLHATLGMSKVKTDKTIHVVLQHFLILLGFLTSTTRLHSVL